MAEIQRLRQLAQYHPNAGPISGQVAFDHSGNDGNMNPYAPQNVLPPKHFQRHNRSSSKHSRSQTVVPGFMNRANLSPQQQAHNRGSSRRNPRGSVKYFNINYMFMG